MTEAAKEKMHHAPRIAPAMPALLRWLLLLVVSLCLPQTRVWSFADAPQNASAKIAALVSDTHPENAFVWQYDASDSPVAAKGATNPWVMGTYREMQAVTAGERGALQAHHILEERHLLNWGLDASKAPAVVLSRQEHSAVTSLLRQELPYGEVYSREAVWNAYQKVYAEAPEWLNGIKGYFKKP